MTAIRTEFDWDVPSVAETAPDSDVPMWQTPELDDWVHLPALSLRPAPEAQLQAKEVVDWTGMSRRQLSAVLGTTHPTVSALLEGYSTQLGRRPEVRGRLESLHRLCERLAPLVHFDREELAAVLFASPEEGASRIVDIATADSPAAAYVAALKFINPRPQRRLKKRFGTIAEGTATVDLMD